jgi:H+-transporting ATPase
VWAYSIPFFLLNDRIKMLAYRIFDPLKAPKSSDLTPRIMARAYALYEQEGHHDGHATQDWDQAEREIRKEESHK